MSPIEMLKRLAIVIHTLSSLWAIDHRLERFRKEFVSFRRLKLSQMSDCCN